jgi:hypothetical protein
MIQDTFLERLAKHFVKHYGNEPEETLIIFPNKRAGIFFRNALIKINNKVQWLPEITSSEEFVRNIINVTICEPITQLFEFYIVYCDLEKENAESFDVFSTWAQQLLHDFQEIDLYCVDVKSLFGSIDAAYALKCWSPDGIVITANQEQFLKFWSRMKIWYHAFREHLQEKKMRTNAMAYRELAENTEKYNDKINWKKIIFAGFNALNNSEIKIIKYLEKQQKIELIWDSDPYYVSNKINEAGYFNRRNLKEFPTKEFNFSNEYYKNINKKIEVIGVAKNIGQTIVASGVLKELNKERHSLSETALILCDEQLLMPMLEQLPVEIEDVNITMGYPMYLLPICSLFQTVFDIQQKIKLSNADNQKAVYYFKDILRLLRNPTLNNFLNKDSIELLIQKIQNNNYVYLTSSFLLEPFYEFLSPFSDIEFILKPWNDNVAEAIDCITKLTEFLKNKIELKEESKINLEFEALFSIFKFTNRISEWKDNYIGFDSIKTFNRIFNQLLKQQTLSFYGEPLTGLQIMGILETRNLDFKNIILLSVNENVLPSAKTHNSFIPFDIAKMAGLPSYKERDAIFAYHFYRLLQRAENVWLLYNTESDEFGKGEQSRYITQLEEELKSNNIVINKSFFIPQLPKQKVYDIKIEKNNIIIDKIKFNKNNENEFIKFSPTGLSVFNACTLKYYFQYIERIDISESLEDEIGMNVVGEVIHSALQEVFTPYLNRVLTPESIDEMLSKIKLSIQYNFHKLIDKGEIENGKNHLIWKSAEKMAENYLLAEKESIKILKQNNQFIELIGLEEKCSFPIEMNINNDNITVLLEGKVDRIDRINGAIRISDYKTGKFESKEIKLDNVNEILGNAEKSKALQLSHYVLIAQNRFPNENIMAGIIGLKRPSEGFQALNIGKIDIFNKKESETITDLFKKIIQDIFDPSKPFEKTNDLNTCTNCNFKDVCQR